MAKSKTPAQYLSTDATPDATTTVQVSAFRAPASDWERANVCPGWHVRVAVNGGEFNGVVRLVGSDNRTLNVDTDAGPVTTTKDTVLQVNMRPLTEWESGMLAKVVMSPDLASFYSPPRFDPLAVCHVIRVHWFRFSGGAKTARVLKAMAAEAKAAGMVSSSPTTAAAALPPVISPAPAADAS